MNITDNRKMTRREFYEFFLYLNNYSIGFTRNEMKLLAFMMDIYPEHLTTFNRRIFESQMKVRSAYVSQLLVSLRQKKILKKVGKEYHFANKQFIGIATKFKNANEFDIVHNISVS